MEHEIIVEARECQALVNKETIQEFIADIADYLHEDTCGEIFEYLEDGSIGFAALDHGHIIVNYFFAIKSVRINIFLRKQFDIPELETRMNFYFIPLRDYLYKEVK